MSAPFNRATAYGRRRDRRRPEPRDRQPSQAPLLLRATVGGGMVVATGVALLRATAPAVPDPTLALPPAGDVVLASAAVSTGVAPPLCQVRHEVTSRSVGRFRAIVTLTNNGPRALNGWTLRWRYPGASPDAPVPRLGDGWNANVSSDASGRAAAVGVETSRVVPPGASTTFAFVGTGAGGTSASEPTAYTANGKPCATP